MRNAKTSRNEENDKDQDSEGTWIKLKREPKDEEKG
jgi:hypothetical protein